MGDDYIFSADQLTKKYRECTALDNVSLSIKAGEVFGLIGENGAGKTTLMKIIAGSSNATSGDMSVMGATGKHIQEQRKNMGVIIENPSCYGDMTGAENLEIIRIAKRIPDKTVVDTALTVVGLYDVKSRKVSKYSLGMRQRLGLAMALLGSPEFLILDEPINGLDPNGIIDMRNTISRLNKENGITFLVSTHILTELNQVATRYGILHKGRLIAVHSAQQLQDQCKKHITILHDDSAEKIVAYLQRHSISNITANGNVIRFNNDGNIPPDLLLLLAKEGFKIVEYFSQQESLEEYFVRLIKDREMLSGV